MKNFYLSFLLLLFGTTVLAQYQIGLIPRVSPDKGIYQKIGYTEVELRYGSPAVKGRQIWGNLASYDQVWRAGANNATTIYFSDDVLINGQILAAGTYGLFIIPREQAPWTFIFSNKDKQWGSFRYDAADDALRVDAIPQVAEHNEHLTYTLSQFGFNYGRIKMHWGRMQVGFEFQTNYLQQFIQTVEEKAANEETQGSWVSWVQGAEYLESINAELTQAQQWIEQAEAAAKVDNEEWNKQYYPLAYIRGHILWVKARLAVRSDDYAAAVELTEQLKSIESTYSFYDKKQERESIDQLLEEWQSNLTNE